MATILDEIVESKRRQLESQQRALSLESLQDSVSPSDRDFAAAGSQEVRGVPRGVSLARAGLSS